MTPRLIAADVVAVPDGVEFVDDGDRWTLRATRHLTLDDQRATPPRYDDPSVTVSITTPFTLDELAMVGYAMTQFALPVRAEPGATFDFAPAPDLRSHPMVLPLVLFAPGGTVELLAPLDAWHEQAIHVRQDDVVRELRWGWHGDLVEIPAGFTARLGVFTGTSVSEVLERWGATIRNGGPGGDGPAAPSGRAEHPLLTHLSYWTDNGAAYWYRTEPGRDLTTTLVDKMDELAELGVGLGAVELDSWFYPHEISRRVSEVGYLDVVPPTGMMSWTARDDVLPDGVAALRERLGSPPLVLHSRHISPTSPYLADGEWWEGVAAHPVDPAFFRRWFLAAREWGATCIEQDWMMMTFFGVREVRGAPGRAMDWLRGLDAAAAGTGVSLLWCMALPSDLAATTELSHVVAVRTCDDYRFAADPASLWTWYLTVNALCSALDIAVFKDCFFSAAPPADDERPSDSSPGDGIDGDSHHEVEALLAAMSGGVVGIGDRIGRTDVEVVSRVCRPDGLLLGPDRPIRLTDTSFRRAGSDGSTLCWATTHSGDWIYVVALHVADHSDPIGDVHRLDEPMLVYDWRNETATVTSTIEARLGRRDWGLVVGCPLRPDPDDPDGGRCALIGDPGRYATMSRRRVDATDRDEPVLLLGDGEESSTLRWWSDRRGVHERSTPTRPAVG